MSTTAQSTQQIQQEILYELITANQLLQQISAELQIIKQFTSPGGEFDMNVKENANLIGNLAKLQNIDLNNIQPITRQQIIVEESTMDESP